MKTVHNLGELDWRVAGFQPHAWRLVENLEIGETQQAEIPAIPAPVPGSVQKALLDAGWLPDWNLGLKASHCEWVENRHWIYEAALPDSWLQEGAEIRLRCLGLDYAGSIRLNGWEVATFENSFVPHVVDLTPYLEASGNRLQIIFTCPPRWLGQFGYTSRMKDWKPRFNYYWDWTSRLVQIGIWDEIMLEVVDGEEIEDLRVTTDASQGGVDEAWTGRLKLSGQVSYAGHAGEETARSLRCALYDGEEGTRLIRDQVIDLNPDTSAFELIWTDLEIDLWWPNGLGDHPLYALQLALLDQDGIEIDTATRRVGFKHVEWHPCEGAPEEADPWLCVVNGKPVFLQGVNWTPIRPNFADVAAPAYRDRLELYRDLHMNVLRVWGGAYLEREPFYRLCDELGLLVWQEFPLSSSGIDNYPPDDDASIAEQTEIARSYIRRRQHHVSLFIWCGGNELQDDKDGERGPQSGPLGEDHPMLARFAEIVAEMDPTRRFLPTSASGPRFSARSGEFGKGVHWDVHGPWKVEGDLDTQWQAYWSGDDALMRSEVGAPGPSPVDLIRRYAGECDPFPASYANPLWRRTSWWIEWPEFVAEMGHEPETLETYVAWGQQRQARALRIAAEACKSRFPRCGGFIVWMGHDSFPCTANTSIIDFEGHPKPAAFALAEVFDESTSSQTEPTET
ncbi:MAG: glycoside hydrolase family 2 protein [Anaerolineae bacterium]